MDHTELVLCTLRNADRLPSNTESLIEHIVSPYPPNKPHSLHPKLKLSVADTSGVTSAHKLSVATVA